MATSQRCCHLPGEMLNSAAECADRARIEINGLGRVHYECTYAAQDDVHSGRVIVFYDDSSDEAKWKIVHSAEKASDIHTVHALSGAWSAGGARPLHSLGEADDKWNSMDTPGYTLEPGKDF
jgi:hypothetical protein